MRLLPLCLFSAAPAAFAPPFAGDPPWDAAYSEMGEALTAAGWEVRGDGVTLFAYAGPLEMTLLWDEAGFLTEITFVERWGDETEASEALAARRDALSEIYDDPVEWREGYALWTPEGYDVVLELGEIHSVEGRSPVVLIRYERHEP